MKTLRALVFIVALAASLHAAERTILFVDDHDVLYRSGTRRVAHQPVKHPQNPLITEDKPWELAIGWVSVHRDTVSGKYQLWYQAYAGKRAQQKTHECTVAYAESADGITFTKPDLGLFDFNGDKHTNIVLIGSGVLGDRYCNSVIVDPRDSDPARRYKMLYSDWWKDEQGKIWIGTHAAFSPDGIRWIKRDGPPLHRSYHGLKKVQPPFTGEDPNGHTDLKDGRVRHFTLMPLTHSDAADVIYDPKRKSFLLYGKMWIDGPEGGLGWKHGMGRSESKDFLTWSKPQLVCAPDDADGELEFHTSPVFIHRERYFCVNQILNRANKGMMDVELMISRDGFEWERPFRSPWFIPRGPEGSFDSGTIVTNANMIVHGEEMRFYYGAYSSGAIGGGTDITGDQQKSGVGLATLTLDRFAGIRSHPEEPTAKIKSPPDIGQITLKPLVLEGRTEICVNANAAGGAVWCEILDANGFRVPGFGKADGMPLKEDAICHRFSWKEKKLTELPAGSYHFRLHLQKAIVYAVTLR